MNAPKTPTVAYASLSLGRQLGQGGQGTVHSVANKKINESADDGGWPVVYKEYSASVLPDLDIDALASMVDLPGGLDSDEARWLCEKTAWPAALVERDGRVSGFLMRAVPDRFQFDLRGLSGTRPGQRRLANLEFLLNKDAYVAGVGLTISERDRLAVLADLTATIARLHGMAIAVGDLSPKNLLFATGPRPECFLIDCDAMRLRGATVLPQAETPDWRVPAGEEKATEAGDGYKLALLAVRLFARDQTATDPARLRAISPPLGDLARAGLDPDPTRRPALTVWGERLEAAIPAASAVPATGPVAMPTPTVRQLAPPSPSPNTTATTITATATATNPGGTRPPQWGSATSASPATSPTTARPRPSPRRRTLRTVGGGSAVAIFIATTILGFVLANSHSGNTLASSPKGTESTGASTIQASVLAAPASAHPSVPGSAQRPTPKSTQDLPTASDALAGASIGLCVGEVESNGHAQLAPSNCASGNFQIVQIFNGTNDPSKCGAVTNSDTSTWSPSGDFVACLSYLNPDGPAYHAHKGDCVYGFKNSSPTNPWVILPCQTGNFTVLASYRGTSDLAMCRPLPNYDWSVSFSVPGRSDLAGLLCLSMNYPDAISSAKVGQCYRETDTSSGPDFTAGPCTSGNVVVTGRGNGANCGTDQADSWQSSDYPELAMTVCYRDL